MTCRKWQYFLATAEACELVGNVALQAHLAECAECAEYAREMQALSRAMRSVPRQSPTSDFGDKVRRRIEESTAAAVTPPPVERASDLWSEARAIAQPQAAAMWLLAVLALMLALHQLAV